MLSSDTLPCSRATHRLSQVLTSVRRPNASGWIQEKVRRRSRQFRDCRRLSRRDSGDSLAQRCSGRRLTSAWSCRFPGLLTTPTRRRQVGRWRAEPPNVYRERMLPRSVSRETRRTGSQGKPGHPPSCLDPVGICGVGTVSRETPFPLL